MTLALNLIQAQTQTQTRTPADLGSDADKEAGRLRPEDGVGKWLLGYCDMETFGGGWLMCYTTQGNLAQHAVSATAFAHSPAKRRGGNVFPQCNASSAMKHP